MSTPNPFAPGFSPVQPAPQQAPLQPQPPAAGGQQGPVNVDAMIERLMAMDDAEIEEAAKGMAGIPAPDETEWAQAMKAYATQQAGIAGQQSAQKPLPAAASIAGKAAPAQNVVGDLFNPQGGVTPQGPPSLGALLGGG